MDDSKKERNETTVAIGAIIVVCAVLAFIFPTGIGLVVGAGVFLLCGAYLMATRSSSQRK